MASRRSGRSPIMCIYHGFQDVSPSKSPCAGVFLRAASFLPGRVEKKTDDTLSKIVVSAVNAEAV